MNNSKVNMWMVSSMLLLGLISGFGVAQIPYFKVLGRDTQAATIQAQPTAPTPTAAVPAEPKDPVLTADQIANLADDDDVMGSEDAPVTVVEFSDFQCPYCSRFYTQTYLKIKSDFIDTGKVNFVYRDFPLEFHAQAMAAALSAECAADQGKFSEMHDALFEGQGDWSGNEEASKVFAQYGKKMGLNMTTYNTCVEKKTHDSEIKKDLIDGVTLGVTGTPTFFVNGKVLSGAMPYEQVFKPILEAAVAGKSWELTFDPTTRQPVIKIQK